MIKDITVRRLSDISVKGNFTIHCETRDDAAIIRSIFRKNSDNIRFQDIKDRPDVEFDSFPLHMKFGIKYESLNELLKLREIFRTRGGRFDMFLIRKRGYDPFGDNFYERIADPVIYKVIT